jgi:formate dehydrogenase assembly factor FdhD
MPEYIKSMDSYKEFVLQSQKYYLAVEINKYKVNNNVSSEKILEQQAEVEREQIILKQELKKSREEKLNKCETKLKMIEQVISHETAKVIMILNENKKLLTNDCQAMFKQIKAHLNENVQFDLTKLERNFYTTSSCGVCGKASIDAVKIACPIIVPLDKWKIEKKVLLTLNDSLQNAQENFNFSGGIHASAILQSTKDLNRNFSEGISLKVGSASCFPR